MADPKTEFVELPLDAGVDTYSAPEKVQAPKHLELEDADLDQPGALRSRRAYAMLAKTSRAGSLTGDMSVVRGLITDGNALVALADTASYEGQAASWGSALQRWDLADYAGLFPVTSARSLVDATQVERTEMARAAGHSCVYIRTSETVVSAKERFVVVRDSDNVVVRAGYFNFTFSGTLGSTGACQPHLVAVGDYFFLFWIDGANLKYSRYDPSANQTDWAAATTAFGNVHADHKTIDVYSDGTRVFVVYNHTSGLAVARFHISAGSLVLDVNATGNFVGVFGDVCVAVTSYVASSLIGVVRSGSAGSGDVVAYALNEATLAVTQTYSLDTTTSATELVALSYAATTTYGYASLTVGYTLLLSGSIGMPTSVTRFWRADLGSSSFTQGQAIEGCYLTRRPVRAQGCDIWAIGRETLSGDLSEWLVVDYRWTRGSSPADPRVAGATGFAIVAQLNPLGSAQRNKNWQGIAGSICPADSLGKLWDLPAYEEITHGLNFVDRSRGQIGSRVRMTRLDLRAHVGQHFVQDRQLFVGGSYPRRWTYENLQEGFVQEELRGFQAIVPPMPPDLMSLTQGSGGGLEADALYTYCFTEEFVGPDGRRSQSAPSPAQSIQLAGGNTKVTIDFTMDGASIAQFREPSMRRGERQHHNWVIWRTAGDATDAIFYRVGWVTAGTTTDYEDQSADDDIEQNEILYTVGGELANQSPPPSLAMFPWKDRIVCLHGETGELWPSKSWDASEVGGWNIALAVQTNVWNGPPKFASPLDDKMIVWWGDAIGVVYGEPAADTGNGGTLAPPLLIKKGIGLRDVGSVVDTPDALLFRGQRGFYALGRDMTVAFIGRPAIGLLPATECLGALYLTEREEVRWLFADRLVCYHLTRQEWFQHLLGIDEGEGGIPTIACGVVVGDDATLAFSAAATPSTGLIWQEDTEAGEDPTENRPRLRASTGWVKLGGTLGQQRIQALWLTGSFSDDAQLDLYYDYADTPSAADHKDFVGIATGELDTYLIKPTRQDCHAFRLEFTGKNARLLSARLEVVKEKGTYQREEVRI